MDKISELKAEISRLKDENRDLRDLYYERTGKIAKIKGRPDTLAKFERRFRRDLHESPEN
jgi:hypothetical protein